MSATTDKPHHVRGFLLGLIYGIFGGIIGYIAGYVLQLQAQSEVVSLSVANITKNAVVYHVALSNYGSSTIFPYMLALVGFVGGLSYGLLKEYL